MDIKKDLAQTIVGKFWSVQEAAVARQTFESVVQEKDFSAAKTLQLNLPSECWIVDLLKAVGAVETSSQAKRLIDEGAVKLDNQTITDFKATITWHDGITFQKLKIHQPTFCVLRVWPRVTHHFGKTTNGPLALRMVNKHSVPFLHRL
jgi:tyrosyl-tRNA synthetase